MSGTRSALEHLARTIARGWVRLPGVPGVLRWFSRRGLVPRWVWIHLPTPGAFDVPVEGDGAFVLTGMSPHPAARQLYWRGLREFEYESLIPLRRLAPHCETFADVGANIGVWAFTAAVTNPALGVVTFEALPRMASLLRTNIDASGLGRRISVIEVAVSDTCETASFVDPTHPLPTSARLSSAQYRSTGSRHIDVSAVRLDDRPELADGCDLVKIDVEGSEDKVLHGMQALTARFHPTIFVECLPEGPFEAVDAFARSNDYRIFHLLGGGPVACPTIVPDTTRRFRNFLLIHRADHERLVLA